MKSLILILVGILLSACTSEAVCGLTCQLETNQSESLTVRDFLERLEQHGFITNAEGIIIDGSVQTDSFSHVIETSVTLNVSGRISSYHYSEIVLYISNVGSATDPNWSLIPQQSISSIHIKPEITLPESLLLFGLPQGGEVLPLSPSPLDLTMECQNHSNYIAFYEGGKTVVRAIVQRPIRAYLWTSLVEIVYPIGQELEFGRDYWIGRYSSLNHRPCN